MAAGPYIPAKNAQYQAWLLNFSTVITANPANYGLTSTDASNIAAAYTTWHNAYVAATTAATRTSVTVAAMATAKASSLITARTYAQIIQNNAGVSDANKAAAGLTVRATGRTPIPAPTNVPILSIATLQVGVTQVNYRNSANPTSKQKPYGAIQVQYVWYVAPTVPPVDGDAATSSAIASKSPFLFNTPSGATGKAIYMFARFQTRRGLVGPWSAALNFTAP